ncbi:MAG: hypothetical protein A3B53_03630 [Candidatus Levybacteria bacterium RIFCSPLOWO2_01_FULL_42_15]|nr:MAG: hypothetical protein A3B53_03630 [Candidatus Levybacteria bacterium RIFCSPLOWO2_01_FULL_42_15]
MFPISDSIRTHRFAYLNIGVIGFTFFVFVQQFTSPNLLVDQYALIPALINFSNILTLAPFITAIFLHGGFLHILSNMWFLWVFGDNIETHAGVYHYIVIYFVSGIVGNVMQYMTQPQSSIPMLGASGAVAGILGAYYVLFPHSKIKTAVPFFGFFSVIEVSAPFMLGYWFVLQVFSGALSLPFGGEGGGIAFWAHVGGFATGFLYAQFLQKNNQ